MPDRIIDYKDKMKAGLSFTIPLDLKFTVAISERTSEDFKWVIKNNKEKYSDILRLFVFKRMKILNIKEFEEKMSKMAEIARDYIYEEMGVKRGNSFSFILCEDINKYLKKHGK